MYSFFPILIMFPMRKKKRIYNLHIPPFPEIAAFSSKYFILIKGGVKQLYHELSACMVDNPLVKARGLSPRIGGQTMV